jgi:hypothetical protein
MDYEEEDENDEDYVEDEDDIEGEDEGGEEEGDGGEAYDEEAEGEDAIEYDGGFEEDVIEEEEADLKSRKKPRLPSPSSRQYHPLDLALLKCFKDTTSTSSLSATFKDFYKELAKLVPQPKDHLITIQDCLGKFHESHSLAKTSNLSQAFTKYVSFLDLFLKVCMQLQRYHPQDSPSDLTFNRTMSFVMFDVLKFSRPLKDYQSLETLTGKIRNFKLKFKSDASQCVGLTLSLRMGSGGISFFKSFLDRKDMKQTSGSRVMLGYFRGRLAAIEGNTEEAEDNFYEAFKILPFKFEHNRKLVLEYLIPFRLIHGKFPKLKLLQGQRFSDIHSRYANLLKHAKSGDMRMLLIELAVQEGYFHRLMCFDIVRLWLLAVCKQHILKWIVKIMNNPSTLNLQMLSNLSCWDYENTEVTKPKLEHDKMHRLLCTLSDLISRGLLKGELDFQSNCLTLLGGEKSSFPNLRQRQPKSYKASAW